MRLTIAERRLASVVSDAGAGKSRSRTSRFESPPIMNPPRLMISSSTPSSAQKGCSPRTGRLSSTLALQPVPGSREPGHCRPRWPARLTKAESSEALSIGGFQQTGPDHQLQRSTTARRDLGACPWIRRALGGSFLAALSRCVHSWLTAFFLGFSASGSGTNFGLPIRP